MKFLFTILFFCTLLTINAQNLVPNPSFEIYDTCPNNYGGNNLSNGWYPFSSSPDYFNACSINSSVGVPVNGFGNQNASTGNAYCGFASYHSSNWNELLGRKLSTTLFL